MNRFFTHLVEKSFAYGFYTLRVRTSPNPFQPLTPQDAGWLTSSPEDFYAVPESAPKLELCRDCIDLGSLHDQFVFQSPYPSPHPQNNLVRGLVNLREKGQARAAVIFIHGHAMWSFKLLEWYARPAVQRGMDVYFLTLPYHMQRTPRGAWSGQYSLNANIRGSAMAFRQGVQDLRALMNWIEQERPAPILLAGISLGAFTSLMTAVVDERPAAVLSIIGGGSLAQIIWDGYQMGESKRQLEAGGVSCEQLERDWALMGPANWQPKVDRDRVLLVAGKYDPIVTPRNVERLRDAWNPPAVHWYPTGHATIAVYNQDVKRDIFHFLQRQF